MAPRVNSFGPRLGTLQGDRIGQRRDENGNLVPTPHLAMTPAHDWSSFDKSFSPTPSAGKPYFQLKASDEPTTPDPTDDGEHPTPDMTGRAPTEGTNTPAGAARVLPSGGTSKKSDIDPMLKAMQTHPFSNGSTLPSDLDPSSFRRTGAGYEVNTGGRWTAVTPTGEQALHARFSGQAQQAFGKPWDQISPEQRRTILQGNPASGPVGTVLDNGTRQVATGGPGGVRTDSQVSGGTVQSNMTPGQMRDTERQYAPQVGGVPAPVIGSVARAAAPVATAKPPLPSPSKPTYDLSTSSERLGPPAPLSMGGTNPSQGIPDPATPPLQQGAAARAQASQPAVQPPATGAAALGQKINRAVTGAAGATENAVAGAADNVSKSLQQSAAGIYNNTVVPVGTVAKTAFGGQPMTEMVPPKSPAATPPLPDPMVQPPAVAANLPITSGANPPVFGGQRTDNPAMQPTPTRNADEETEEQKRRRFASGAVGGISANPQFQL